MAEGYPMNEEEDAMHKKFEEGFSYTNAPEQANWDQEEAA